MRVIAGSARGHRLAAPPGRAVRPTADRVREALFSSLAAMVPGARVLDLFTGTGALAIEALSRGAAHATLIERDPRTAAVAERNLVRTGLDDRGVLVRKDAAEFVQDPRGGPFDLILLDPPYEYPLADIYRLINGLQQAGGCRPDVTVVVERDRRDPDLDAQPPQPLRVHRRRSYGDTVLLYLRSKEDPGGHVTFEQRGGRVPE